MIKKAYAFVTLLFLIFRCQPAYLSEAEKRHLEKEISTQVSEKIYPSTAKFISDSCLEIRMDLPELEFFAEERLTLVRKITIAEFGEHNRKKLKEVMFIAYNSKHIGNPTYYRETLLPQEAMEWTAQVLEKDKVRYDFLRFTFRNIRGMEFVDYSALCKGVFEWEQRKKLKEGEYPHFISVIEEYSQECQGKIAGNFYQNTLVKMKRLYAENKDLFEYIDENKMDYFMNKCR